MSHGWIKLHRSMIDWEWYTDQNTSRLFIHCLIRANHSDTKWRGNNIKRGQFITSLDTLSCETGLTVSQVRTALKKLDDTNEIASLSQARSRVITVVKYDQYQSDDKLDSRLIAGSSQADRKLIATDKNVKNENNDNNEKETLSPTGSGNDVTNCPSEQIKTLYNEILHELPSVAILSDKRKAKLRCTWKTDKRFQSIEFWEKLFSHITTSDFLMGKSSDWSASFDFIINQNNLIKIIEGNYHK